MKRYVKEFAEDIKEMVKVSADPSPYLKAARTVTMCEQELITDIDAIRTLVEIYETTYYG